METEETTNKSSYPELVLLSQNKVINLGTCSAKEFQQWTKEVFPCWERDLRDVNTVKKRYEAFLMVVKLNTINIFSQGEKK